MEVMLTCSLSLSAEITHKYALSLFLRYSDTPFMNSLYQLHGTN